MTFPYLIFYQWPQPRAKLFHCGVGWIILLALFTVCPLGLTAAEATPNPRVIILNSYHPGFTWSDEEVAGVLQELRRSYPHIDPAVEYLDTKRFPADDHLLLTKDHLARKYHGKKFDLVIVLDNPALAMVLAHRPELFPGTPVVFTGINDFDPAQLAGKEKVTGDAEVLEIEGTLKLALALHPGTTMIFVVTDDTLSGKAGRKEVEEVLPRLPAGVRVEFAPPATMAELVGRIKGLPATAIVFIAGFATDKAGQTFSMAEGARLLTEGAKIPAYIVHEGLLGYGPVGGMLLGGREGGRRAGEMALQVLAGQDPSGIPVDTTSNARPRFDYRHLARFNIPLKALPAGSIVINSPASFYEIHKFLVWGAAGVVLVLVVVVLVLWAAISRRRQAEHNLQHHSEFMQNLMDSIPNLVFYKDTHGVYLGCNQTLEEFLELPKDGIVGKTVFELYPKDLADKYFAMDRELFDHPGIQVYEFEMARPDGTRRKFIFNKATFLNPEGRLGGLIGVMTDITERKAMEAALAEEAIRRRMLVEQSRDGIVVLDQNGKVYEANQRYADMLGYTPEEVCQLYIWDWDVQWTREQLLDQIRRVDAAGDHFETRHRRQDGSLLDVEISTNGAVLDGQKLVFCVCRDISARKAAEEALRESEEKFRLVFEKAPLGIMHYDQMGVITDCNEQFAAIIGAPKEEFLGFNMIRQLRDDQMRAAVAASLQGETGYYEGDYLSVTAGKLTPARAIFQPIFSPEGKVSGGVSIFEDISVRQQAEEALRITRENLELALKGADLGTWDWDIKTGAVTFNERWMEMLGYRRDEIEPRLRVWKKLVHPEDLPAVLKALNAHLEGKTAFFETEYRMQHKSGGWVWVLDKGKVIERDAQGRPVRACGTHLDVTERKRDEAERLRFSKLESLATLAGGIAHDFNNILTGILGNISLARLDRQEGQRLADAERACLRAKALAHQLLTFAKGGVPIKEPLSVAKLVTETGSFACRGSNVRCEFSLPDNLWTIYADSGQLGQVFQNLVINALQAMPAGGIIKIQGENLVVEGGGDLPLAPGKYVEISIQDQGLGIPAEYLPRIFDPYFTTKQTGSGLGLATAYSIIKAHQGHIAVESTLGAGTIFHVYLLAVEEKIVEPPKGDRGVIKGEGKILVMDDDELVQEVIGRMLGHLGYEVTAARDGDEAVKLFAEARKSGAAFDAVILDLTVPGGMGGKAALEKLLQIDPQVKAIVSSGYSEDAIMAEYAQHGFSGAIAKPYRIAELSVLLNKVIGKGYLANRHA